MGERKIGLQTMMRREHCIDKGGTRWSRLNSGIIQAGGFRGGRHSVSRRGTFGKNRKDTSRSESSLEL